MMTSLTGISKSTQSSWDIVLPQSDPDSDVQPLNKRAKVEEPDVISSDEESEEETPAVRINQLSPSDMIWVASLTASG